MKTIISKTMSKTIENETKQLKDGFLRILLGTLGASLLGNLSISRSRINS